MNQFFPVSEDLSVYERMHTEKKIIEKEKMRKKKGKWNGNDILRYKKKS